MSERRWLAHRVRNPRARLRLFCYPHAGGGASAFLGWRGRLPEAAELCPLEPPGRWSRNKEPLERNVHPLAASLVEDLEGALDVPYVLLGHSVGAFVMFEAARSLGERGPRAPEHLVVASRGAPHFPKEGPDWSKLPDDALLYHLGKLYGSDRLGAMEDPDLRALFLPVIRADLEVLETYDVGDAAAIGVPISAYGGRADPSFHEEKIAAWEDYTREAFHTAAFEGDHFFVHDPASGFLDRLGAIVEEVIARG